MTVQPGMPLAESPSRDASLPEPLVSVLLAARAEEENATGIDRRPAYRTTRIVIGALREAGYSTTLIARTLGISIGSVRARAESGGLLPKKTICALTGLSSRQFTALAARHSVTPADETTPSMFRMLEIVRALVGPESTSSAHTP